MSERASQKPLSCQPVDEARTTAVPDVERDAIRYRSLLAATAGLIWHADPAGRIGAVPVSGDLDQARLQAMRGHGWWDFLHPDDRQDFLLKALRARRRKSGLEGIWRIAGADGGYRWNRIRIVPLCDALGEINEWVGKASDDHERYLAQERVAESEARLRLALSAARMVAWEFFPETRKSSRTDNSHVILGIDADDFEGYIENMHPEDRAGFHEAYVEGGSMRVPELRYHHPDGRLLWLSSRGVERRDADGRRRIIGVTYDITDRKVAEEEIWRVANHDPLTGLPNRSFFLAMLGQQVAHGAGSGGGVALALLDYLDFKALDAALGHEGADALLRRTGERLRKRLGRDDIVARIGGDEFGVFLADVANADEAAGVAQALSEALAEDFYQADHILTARVCIGIAWSGREEAEGEALFRQAQNALHAAKQSARRGGAQVQLFDDDMVEGVTRRAGIAVDVARALRRGEIIPFYQPKIDLDSGMICGFEALARWRHPQRGVLTPAIFGSAFEIPELARDIGREMARQVLDDLRGWIDSGLAVGPVALNLAAVDFSEGGLAWLLPDMLAEHGVPARFCAVEVTERVFLGEGGGAVAAALTHLDRAGIRIALDDFGTGYASLVHLKQFPVSEIKIDRSFIHDLETDAEDAAIVAALLGLARALSLDVTAEGVETEAQAAFLRDHHCELAQGFLFAKPMARDCASALLTRQKLERNTTRRRRRSRDAGSPINPQRLLAGQG